MEYQKSTLTKHSIIRQKEFFLNFINNPSTNKKIMRFEGFLWILTFFFEFDSKSFVWVDFLDRFRTYIYVRGHHQQI